MVESSLEGRLEMFLAELRLPSIRKVYRKISKDVTNAGGDHIAFLHALLEEEINDRRSRRIHRLLKEGRFPQMKLLSEIEGSALPRGISLDQLHNLARGEYIEEKSNIVAIGGSGTGKTHISIALGIEACKQSRRVRFSTATDLVSELEEAQEAHQLHRYLKRLVKVDLLVVDELGYLPMTERAAELLFQAFSSRHERGSIIVNSNLPFSEWGEIFKTERLAVALLDRVTHNAHTFEMNGESYRLRTARSRSRRKSARKENSMSS